ncbi:type II toxin-antitoxin system RelE/ParE family toxin [Salmonella enterica]|nr:type II toxin-antitoxin system RelE/ParE family toxin [Salmonella enterica]EHO2547736.1 type II toxin-antitoxin system RelE/ParE family toxin [Salmonella enterica]EHO4090567.1 type II toxin-antitoxin system RelE/ParE family toxin [Salmonella enterica]EHO4240991.1 type II toxin-antitoxin system RelE/ParE family toxin [Salmonella enterica]EJI2704567.1 type II toxin-antitoxin system RelE/ParE family toxin [Salmonella enterica]
MHILRGVRQQQDEPGRFSICSRQAAVVQSLTQAPVILLTHPRMGEQLFQFEPREVRRIFAGEYEIRYELNDQTIYVLRLWHTRENR